MLLGNADVMASALDDDAPSEGAKRSAQPCAVCNNSVFKYKCPKCGAKSCSLSCVKAHKAQVSRSCAPMHV